MAILRLRKQRICFDAAELAAPNGHLNAGSRRSLEQSINERTCLKKCGRRSIRRDIPEPITPPGELEFLEIVMSFRNTIGARLALAFACVIIVFVAAVVLSIGR